MLVAFAIFMNHKAQQDSGSIDKQAFVAVLRRFAERYGPTDLVITESRETASRYRWLAELKSKLGRYLARGKQHSVEHAYTINGNQLRIETDEKNNLVLAVRIHPGHTPADIREWLVVELRKLSPALVSVVEEPR